MKEEEMKKKEREGGMSGVSLFIPFFSSIAHLSLEM